MLVHTRWTACLLCAMIAVASSTDQLFPRMGSAAARARRFPKNTADPEKAKAMAAMAVQQLGSKDGDIYDLESRKLLGGTMNNTNYTKELTVDPASGWGVASQLTRAILDTDILVTDIMDGHSENGTGANYGIPGSVNASNGTIIEVFNFNKSDITIAGAIPKPIKMLPYVISAGDPYHPDGDPYNIPPRPSQWGELPRYDVGQPGGPKPWATPEPPNPNAVKVEGGMTVDLQPWMKEEKDKNPKLSSQLGLQSLIQAEAASAPVQAAPVAPTGPLFKMPYGQMTDKNFKFDPAWMFPWMGFQGLMPMWFMGPWFGHTFF